LCITDTEGEQHVSFAIEDEQAAAEPGSQIVPRPVREGRRVAADADLANAGLGLPELVAAIRTAPEQLAEAAKRLRADDREALPPILFKLIELAELGEKAFKALRQAGAEELDHEITETGQIGRGGDRYLTAVDEHGVQLRAIRAKNGTTTRWEDAKVVTALAASLGYTGPKPPFPTEADLNAAFHAGAVAGIELAVKARTGEWRTQELERIAAELGRDDPTNAGLLISAKTRQAPKPSEKFKGTAKIEPIGVGRG
jgi:hypothetical protein